MAHANIAIVWGQSNVVGANGTHTNWVGSLPMSWDHSYWVKSGVTTESLSAGATESADKVGASSWTPLSMGIGQSLVDDKGVTDLVVVTVAEGSTSLADDWADGTTLSQRLYDYVQALTATFDTWSIIGIYVAEGESDTNDADDTTNFEANMRTKAANLWRDFGENVASSVPIVWGQITKDPSASPSTTETIAAVNLAISTVAGDTSNVSTITTSDIPQVDTVHFSVPGRQTWGVRAAAS